MKELERNADLLYVLERDRRSRLFLTVTCGGIAMYDVRICLNDDEQMRYSQDGATFLDGLARDICKDPARYHGRAAKE